MTRGRPPKGLGHVDSLSGDARSKARVKTILATLAGDLPVPQACEQLGVSESRFHQLRHAALSAMLEGVAPRPAGRPPRTPEEDEEVAYLRARLGWLEEELEISRVRTEIALVDPKLLRDPIPCPPPERPEKKGSSEKRQRRSQRRKRDGTGDT